MKQLVLELEAEVCCTTASPLLKCSYKIIFILGLVLIFCPVESASETFAVRSAVLTFRVRVAAAPSIGD
jgi:hypothetical protein